jgi:hypothetical protein
MIGNPYKGVVQDPILEDTAPVLVLASTGATNSVDYTVPTGRGKVQAIEVIVASDTLADIAAAQITISASGKTLFNTTPLVKHSTFYNNSRNPAICQVDESVPINISGAGVANNNVSVFIVFYFYDPYLTTFVPTVMQAVK